jgi:hypothetical protein
MGNVSVEDGRVTRLVRSYEPADHRLLRAERGQREYSSPVRPPFSSLDEPAHFDNPRSVALGDLQQYFESFFKCVNDVTVPASAVACSARILAP